MANVFKNAYKDATASLADLIAPLDSNHYAIVLTIRATNVDGTNDATVDCVVKDGGSAAESYIAKGVTVPAGTSIELAAPSKIVLEATDQIEVLASATNDIEFFASYLEVTD